MHFIIHLLAGIVGAAALSLPLPNFLIFVAASVLIDADHLLEWKQMARIMSKNGYLLNIEKYRKEVNYSGLQRSLHPFHTFEILGIIAVAGLCNQIFALVAGAFALHILLDAIGNIWERNLKHRGREGWLKYWFLTYYIIKRDVWNRENL